MVSKTTTTTTNHTNSKVKCGRVFWNKKLNEGKKADSNNLMAIVWIPWPGCGSCSGETV